MGCIKIYVTELLIVHYYPYSKRRRHPFLQFGAKNTPWPLANRNQNAPDISHGSVATCFRCDGISSDESVTD